MEKVIFVITGGQWQVPIIRECQLLGYKVLNTNLYSHTPGAQVADFFVEADVKDVDKNLEVAKQYKPCAVLTDQSDIAVVTVAHVAEQQKLPGIGIECALRFTDKLLMRQLASEIGVPCPPFYELKQYEPLERIVKEIGFPLVVKPRSSQGSRGVTIVHSESELRGAVKHAFAASFEQQSILIEGFIDGTEYTVEGFKDHTKHHSLAISQKQGYSSCPTVSEHILYKQEFKGIDVYALKEQNDKLVEALGLPFGITHAEYKYVNGTFYLIEIAARGGGNNISSHLAKGMSGINLNQYLVRYALGETPLINSCDIKLQKCQVMKLVWLKFTAGKVIQRTSPNKILEIEGVIDFNYNFELGDELVAITDDTTRHGHVIIKAQDEEQLDNIVSEVQKEICIEYQ
ncbi:ATP-grasp domain-containing protein [Thalassotalea montiporae]